VKSKREQEEKEEEKKSREHFNHEARIKDTKNEHTE
jgi:hypothetical protein